MSKLASLVSPLDILCTLPLILGKLCLFAEPSGHVLIYPEMQTLLNNVPSFIIALLGKLKVFKYYFTFDPLLASLNFIF